MTKLSGDSPDFSSKKLASQTSRTLLSFIKLAACWLCLDQFVLSNKSISFARFLLDCEAEDEPDIVWLDDAFWLPAPLLEASLAIILFVKLGCKLFCIP